MFHFDRMDSTVAYDWTCSWPGLYLPNLMDRNLRATPTSQVIPRPSTGEPKRSTGRLGGKEITQ